MDEIRGVVLAGGLGARLAPVTLVTNKHLLPVYDKPMIFYPIETLVKAGIDEILLVTGGEHAGDFLRVLGTGEQLGVRRLHYTYQQGEGGIADALRLAEPFAEGHKICVILGDNLIGKDIRTATAAFAEQKHGARILLKEVPDPERFGVVQLEDGRITRIIEKPTDPPSNLAVIGIYYYDGRVFDIVRTLKPSKRGELEITDVNNAYLEQGTLEHDVLEGWWTDAGTFESLHSASNLVRDGGANRVS